MLKATRFRYKVRVPRILSEKEIRSLSSDIIEQAPPHNGMDIYFYLPDSTLETGFTAGYSPNLFLPQDQGLLLRPRRAPVR